METWPSVKSTTPFGTLPILIETVPSTGQTIQIPDSGPIERYLGQKFGLLGSNPREQILNDIFYAQAVMLNTQFVEKVAKPLEEVRVRSIDDFLNVNMAKWVEICEKHLAENGQTGHFVDNKVTLADIKSAVVMDNLMAINSGHILNATNSPGLWKLKQTIDTHPRYAVWRTSKAYAAIDRDTEAGVASKMSFDLQKTHVFA